MKDYAPDLNMQSKPDNRVSGPEDQPEKRRILIVAGEASGDLHGARLVKNLLQLSPDLEIYGIGGDAMVEAGVRLLVHSSELAVVGIVEILSRLRQILGAFGSVKRCLVDDPPHLVILIDFPDFNLRVAKVAFKRGVPVVYYISPQVWAWRRWRIRQIKRYVAHMLVIFPFEETMYQRHEVPVTYVGHPLLDRFDSLDFSRAREEAYAKYGLSPLYPVIGLFPGSRASEVGAHLPVIIRSAQALHRRFPRLQFLLGESPGLPPEAYDEFISGIELPLKRARTGIVPEMGICHLSIIASGSATLEAALFGMPMIIMYRVSRITFALGRLLVRVPSVGMVNLVLEKGVVPELLQEEVNEERLLESCSRFLCNSIYYSVVKRELGRVAGLLGQPGASPRAARVIMDLLLSRSDTGRQLGRESERLATN